MNLHRVWDCFLPTIEDSDTQDDSKDPAPWTSPSILACKVVDELVSAQRERCRSVDAKLQALIPLAPVVVTLIVAFVAFLTRNPAPYRVGSVVVAIYVALQLIRTLFAAVTGIQRKAFRELWIKEVTPKDQETEDEYRVRITNEKTRCLVANTRIIDDKVTQLAVAHRAIKNALFGLLILLLLLGGIAVYNAVQP